MIDDLVTVVVPTSPVPSHPSTEVIERTIKSIRHHLPLASMQILCDGVRPELQFRAQQYAEYISRLGQCCEKWEMCLVPFRRHRQQAGMLKVILQVIDTPLFMFAEHDAVLTENPIDWEAIVQLLMSGKANTVRLYWNADLHPEHLHLMGERCGDFVKTTQWSGWPFIGRTDFYRRMMEEYFSSDDKQMLETVLYSPVVSFPWETFRTWIYAPPGNGVTFRHMDARRDPVTGEKDPGTW